MFAGIVVLLVITSHHSVTDTSLFSYIVLSTEMTFITFLFYFWERRERTKGDLGKVGQIFKDVLITFIGGWYSTVLVSILRYYKFKDIVAWEYMLESHIWHSRSYILILGFTQLSIHMAMRYFYNTRVGDILNSIFLDRHYSTTEKKNKVIITGGIR